MWVSLSWLGEFTDLGERSPEQIAADLTMRTALIEGIVRRGELPEQVIVAQVLARAPHPAADRLSVCEVDTGSGTVQVVCGAANVAAGQTVVLARDGAVLPGERSIGSSEIRGVRSHGMLCSEHELGLAEASGGILVLNESLEPGTPFRDVPGVRDVVLDIDNKSVTHRPDLWGHIGFARELAAIYRGEFRTPPVADSTMPGEGVARIEIEAGELCGRYHALLLSGAVGRPSPGWLQRRLGHCGLRPLSLAVDISNYMMLESGQPTHPFDRQRLRGDLIRVRRSTAGERLVTLDGEDRAIPAGLCVIADAERVIAIAGVIGGRETGIGPETPAAIVECASFDAIAVRRAGTALGLRTDALARFEKFLDPDLAEWGVRRFAALTAEVAPDIVVSPTFASAGDLKVHPVTIRLRPQRVGAKLGIELATDQIATLLQRLGFSTEPAGEALSVRVPGFRGTRDVRIEDDLIEEVGRIHGYDRIAAVEPRFDCSPSALEPINAATRQVVALLSGRLGFAEVASYAFVEQAVLERAGCLEDQSFVRLKNPLQRSADRMRRSLVPWMVEFVDRNIKAVDEVRLFECGRVFLHDGNFANLPDEPQVVVAAWASRSTRKGESGKVLRLAKGALEDVLQALGRPADFERGGEGRPGWAHPGRAAELRTGDRSIGWLAQVHPTIATRLGWLGEVALFEINLSALVDQPLARHGYRPPPRFPGVRRDLSFVAPFTLPYRVVAQGLQSLSALIDRVELVDEYVAAGAESGQRSLTMRLCFRSNQRTLTDDEVGEVLNMAQAWLREHGAVLRG